jgi:hypothetical protein
MITERPSLSVAAVLVPSRLVECSHVLSFDRRLALLRLLCFSKLGVLGSCSLVVGVHQHVRYLHKRLLNMLSSFGTSLDVVDLRVLLQECFYLLKADLPTAFQVALVPYHQNLGLGGTRILDLVVPIAAGVLEGLPVGDVVYDHEGMGSAVVRASDGPETFVACSVPDLQFDLISPKREGLKSEVDPDGGEEDLTEFVIGVSDHDGGLPDTGVADEYYFEEIMVLPLALQHS